MWSPQTEHDSVRFKEIRITPHRRPYSNEKIEVFIVLRMSYSSNIQMFEEYGHAQTIGVFQMTPVPVIGLFI